MHVVLQITVHCKQQPPRSSSSGLKVDIIDASGKGVSPVPWPSVHMVAKMVGEVLQGSRSQQAIGLKRNFSLQFKQSMMHPQDAVLGRLILPTAETVKKRNNVSNIACLCLEVGKNGQA